MPLATQSNNPTMKRYILSMSLIAAFLMSACGEKSNTPEAKKAKLESLKKEIAQLQAEASVLEKELNAGAVADMGKTVEIATVKKGFFKVSFLSKVWLMPTKVPLPRPKFQVQLYVYWFNQARA